MIAYSKMTRQSVQPREELRVMLGYDLCITGAEAIRCRRVPIIMSASW